MSQHLFAPSECLSLLAVFSDACKEVELLSGMGKHNFPSQYGTASGMCGQVSPDALLTELNKIFFQTLLRYEKARSEDYLELPDGTFRKLNDEEGTRVKYLDIVGRVLATLRNVLFELDETGTFTTLEKYCQQEQSELDKLATFVSSAAEKEQSLTKLQGDMRELQHAVEKDSVEFFNILENLKHEFQELREMSKMTIQYKTKQYSAKLQRRLDAYSDRFKICSSEVEYIKGLISQSLRVGEETSSWLCADISEKVNLFDLVPKNDHPDKLALKLELMRKQLEERQALRAELTKQYENYTEILIKDDREKEAKRVREEYAKKVMMSIIQIQSWWRTMMASRGIRVRRKRRGKKGGKQLSK
ncbi:unnamed protein product [Dicrocoelium dendriticum]|nr:unnamed protein product [Dicrocoelium dendriticum]